MPGFRSGFTFRFGALGFGFGVLWGLMGSLEGLSGVV